MKLEEPVQFATADGKMLYGILHNPKASDAPLAIVIIITGGPQIRTGSHRLYVQLGRYLSSHDIATLRFDYEGLGDSEGDFVGYKHAGPSIASAIKFVSQKYPVTNNSPPILWSLCDGATATALYAKAYPEQIRGLVLCNPLVLTDESLARANIKHYYLKRFLAKDFWKRLLLLKLDFNDSSKSLWNQIKEAGFFFQNKTKEADRSLNESLPVLFWDSLQHFDKPVRMILSEDDIVALNFLDFVNSNKYISKLYRTMKIANFSINNADHTFIDPEAKKQLFSITLKSIQEIESASK